MSRGQLNQLSVQVWMCGVNFFFFGFCVLFVTMFVWLSPFIQHSCVAQLQVFSTELFSVEPTSTFLWGFLTLCLTRDRVQALRWKLHKPVAFFFFLNVCLKSMYKSDCLFISSRRWNGHEEPIRSHRANQTLKKKKKKVLSVVSGSVHCGLTSSTYKPFIYTPGL